MSPLPSIDHNTELAAEELWRALFHECAPAFAKFITVHAFRRNVDNRLQVAFVMILQNLADRDLRGRHGPLIVRIAIPSSTDSSSFPSANSCDTAIVPALMGALYRQDKLIL